MDLTQWEKRNPRLGNDETNQAWERELEDDECMRDAPPPPPRSRTNSLSTHSSDGDAPPREAVELCGICMLIEHMMANPPPGAAEPQQLSAFWATTDAMAGAVPMPNVAELHDFLFRLFATTCHTPECSVLALIVMVAQKNHDDAPLRNVDFATAWGHVLPCMEIKFLRRVRAESSRRPPRHRRDTCSMAWRCWFLTARRTSAAAPSPRNDLVKNCSHPTHWLISTQVLPGERPVSPERINAMEHILLNGLGFDLHVPRDQYEACVAELHGVVRSHAANVHDLPVLLQRHAEFLTTQAARLPWTTPP